MFQATDPSAAVPPPPWQGGPTPHVCEPTKPKTMTMREFCHYLFKNKQDVMLAIVQANREPRRKSPNASHPFLYKRSHDEAATNQLIRTAQSYGITLTGTFKQQVNSYQEYRSEHLNYKSCAKRKMNIPVVNKQPQTIPTFVSNDAMDEAIKVATRLSTLEAEKAALLPKLKSLAEETVELEQKAKAIEAEQRELVRKLSTAKV